MHNAQAPPGLFEAFPGIAGQTPWMRLGDWPTPVARLGRLGPGDLWIKRDDLSSPVYGGNKVRKLEFILADALRKGRRHLVTQGGIGSNHALATAIFCRRLELRATLILFRQPLNDRVRQNLALMQASGARLVYRPTLGRALSSYFIGLRLRHPRAYFVFPGGSSPAGTLGFVSAAFELKRQVDSGEIPEPGFIFCPFGSGGTLAGLALGAWLAGLASRVVGVRVTAARLGPFSAANEATVGRLMDRTLARLGRGARTGGAGRPPAPLILHDYFGTEYGAPTAEGLSAERRMLDCEGIRLDPTYTGKTVAAVLDFCEKRGAGEGPVLYWHTFNSADLGGRAAGADLSRLPAAFSPFLEAGDEA